MNIISISLSNVIKSSRPVWTDLDKKHATNKPSVLITVITDVVIIF